MMARPNTDLTADPLTDEEIAHLEMQLRRGVLRPRDTWLGLLARLRVEEHTLATMRAQPRRDELAREVQQLARENAGLDLRHAERDRAANMAEEHLAQAQRRLCDLQAEHDRVLREREDERWQRALTREEVRRLHQVDIERVQSAARLREADLQARLERAERERGDRDAQRAARQLLKDQFVAAQQTLDRHRAATAAVRAEINALFDRAGAD